MQEDCFNFRQNLTMLTDFYEFTMINGYFVKGIGNKIAYFDMFFRKVPDGRWICDYRRNRAACRILKNTSVYS